MFISVIGIFLGCLFISIGTEAAERRWSYLAGDDGPLNWYKNYPTCKGNRQSPINIKSSDVVLDATLPAFTFVDYDKANGVSMALENDGHAAKVSMLDQSLRIRDGGLPEDYRIVQFHFHWGSTNSKGSEHQVNGMKYPLEMHIVHMKASETVVTKAANMTNGLAVLGVLIELGDQKNDNFDQLFKHLASVKIKGTQRSIEAFPLQNLLPENKNKYFRYDGGLTTPACFQSVIWTLFHDTVKISEDQLKQLRDLQQEHDGNTMPLQDNFRPIQDLAGRKVHTSAEFMGVSSAGTATWQVIVTLCTFTAAIFLQGNY